MISVAKTFMQKLSESSSSVSTGTVLLTRNPRYPILAHLTISNPRHLNAFTPRMMNELSDRVTELEGDSTLTCVLIRGSRESKSFCTGVDLSVARQEMITTQAGMHMCALMQDTLSRLRGLPIVSIAVMDGHCIGGGAELATACDLRFMEEDSSVRFVQRKMGITPGWGGASRLVKLVGRQHALQILCGMRPLSAYESLTVGLCDNVFKDTSDRESDQDMSEILFQQVMPYLAENPEDAQVLRSMKQVIIADSLDTEREIFGSLWGSGKNLRIVSASRK